MPFSLWKQSIEGGTIASEEKFIFPNFFIKNFNFLAKLLANWPNKLQLYFFLEFYQIPKDGINPRATILHDNINANEPCGDLP